MSNDIFIGLMSGTSVDGLDIVAASFPTENTIKIIAFDTVEFDVQLRSSLSELSESHSLHETLKIERAFSDFTASAVNEFCQSRIPPQASVNGIGFHGHTAFHDPLDRITFQIGDGSWLAAKTKLPVVADIRRKDVAIGGQGAPLAPAFHLQFL